MTIPRVFVGDLHVGSLVGPSPRPQNQQQEWLTDSFRKFVQHTNKVTGRNHILMLGGDIVDAPGKRNRDDALALLQPMLNTARAVYAVPGTAYHAGEDGEEDRTIYDVVGARGDRARQVHRLKCGERWLWWAHHGVSVGGYPWTAADGMFRTAKKVRYIARDEEMPPPDLVVGHHVHTAKHSVEYDGTRVEVCPCWQLQNDYAAKRVTWTLPTIGAMIWWPESNRVERVTYAIPEKLRSA